MLFFLHQYDNYAYFIKKAEKSLIGFIVWLLFFRFVQKMKHNTPVVISIVWEIVKQKLNAKHIFPFSITILVISIYILSNNQMDKLNSRHIAHKFMQKKKKNSK